MKKWFPTAFHIAFYQPIRALCKSSWPAESVLPVLSRISAYFVLVSLHVVKIPFEAFQRFQITREKTFFRLVVGFKEQKKNINFDNISEWKRGKRIFVNCTRFLCLGFFVSYKENVFVLAGDIRMINCLEYSFLIELKLIFLKVIFPRT